MKSVLMSIKPKYCELIASGKKTIEVRKSKPKLKTPFKCYIYCTKGKIPFLLPTYSKGGLTDSDIWMNGNGKVVGEFICDEITGGYLISPWGDYIQKKSCLTYAEIEKYAGDKPVCSWHISNLVIYDKPKDLREFMVIDKDMLKECPYRIRAYNNPDCTNGAWLKGAYVCNNSFEPDFCIGQCGIATKPLTRPPQSWCYVEV